MANTSKMKRAERMGIIADARRASAEGDHRLAAALFQIVGISYIGGGK